MSITVSKTRDKLVDVARQLFARIGFEKTTMNDIAQASNKGRRTLYTYFKNKDDILLAVVESEMDQLQKILAELVEQEMPAVEKLAAFLYTRLDAMKMIVARNGTIRAAFFRDIWRVEKARKTFNIQETLLIKKILDDGVEEGVFEMPDIEATAYIIHQALRGLDVPYIRGKMSDSDSDRQNVMNLFFNGIKKKQ
jgi:AcrR family transcriptional regulator